MFNIWLARLYLIAELQVTDSFSNLLALVDIRALIFWPCTTFTSPGVFTYLALFLTYLLIYLLCTYIRMYMRMFMCTCLCTYIFTFNLLNCIQKYSVCGYVHVWYEYSLNLQHFSDVNKPHLLLHACSLIL